MEIADELLPFIKRGLQKVEQALLLAVVQSSEFDFFHTGNFVHAGSCNTTESPDQAGTSMMSRNAAPARVMQPSAVSRKPMPPA